ncbi:hypothetical protein QBZ16_002891 [Prototheca wickerhamii]|uniref:GYF domain-containing protein n=1 Tax=Prototheca wickerhamii TaxID=3111 RepID=A0AAD9ML62_PROWI|nr:hypothetical protein QBZ16_002891 [Prototheca wickerhamii]
MDPKGPPMPGPGTSLLADPLPRPPRGDTAWRGEPTELRAPSAGVDSSGQRTSRLWVGYGTQLQRAGGPDPAARPRAVGAVPRYRYGTDAMARIYKALLYAGELLQAPALAAREHSGPLFLPPGSFVDVLEQLQGFDPVLASRVFDEINANPKFFSQRYHTLTDGFGADAQEGADGHAEERGHAAPTAPAPPAPAPPAPPAPHHPVALAEQWEYLDPAGALQGAFSLAQMLAWVDADYFPPAAAAAPAGSGGPFFTLADVLPARVTAWTTGVSHLAAWDAGRALAHANDVAGEPALGAAAGLQGWAAAVAAPDERPVAPPAEAVPALEDALSKLGLRSAWAPAEYAAPEPEAQPVAAMAVASDIAAPAPEEFTSAHDDNGDSEDLLWDPAPAPVPDVAAPRERRPRQEGQGQGAGAGGRGAPAEEPATPLEAAKEEKPRLAPWATATAAAAAPAASLAQIQAEEAAASARAAAESASQAAATTARRAASGGPLGRGARAGGARARRARRARAPGRAPALDPGHYARGGAEAQGGRRGQGGGGRRRGPAARSGWGAAATLTAQPAPSLRSVMQEEEERAADLEGGPDVYDDEDGPVAMPAPVPAKPAPAAAAPAPAPASAGNDEDEDDLFWDYENKPRAKAGNGAAAAAKPAGKPAQAAQPKPSAAVAAGRAAPAKPAAPAPAKPAAAPAKPVPSAPAPSSKLTGELRTWCAEQMVILTGEPDVTLCEVVMDFESNSEAVQCITTNLGSTAAVARFAAEFVNRKLAQQTASKKGKKAAAAAKKAPAAAAQRRRPPPRRSRRATAGRAGVNGSLLGPDGRPSFRALDLLRQ